MRTACTSTIVLAAIAALGLAAHAEPPPDLVAAARNGDAAARARVEAAATAGDAAAARTLGDLAWHGIGRPSDRARGIAWWRHAADGGDTSARYDLGLLAAQDGDFARAEPLLAAAADGGHVLAAYALGTLLAARRDDAAAMRWLERAALADYAPAQFNLAVVHERAGDDPAHVAAARRWYAAAAERFPPAQAALSALDATVAAPPSTTTVTALEQPAESVATHPQASPPRTAASTVPPAVDIQGAAWLREQAPRHYTIQIAAGSDGEPLERLLAAHAAGAPVALLRLRGREVPSFVAVVGSFGERGDAERAAAALPEGLRVHTPWIRLIDGLQRDLEDAQARRE